MRRLRVLVAGLGTMGRRHLRSLLNLGVGDVALLRSRPEPPEDHPDLPVYTSVQEALARRPDLVVVATPASRHLEVALPAARAGCHLFIEKPLAAGEAGLEELCSEAGKRRLVVAVGYDLRLEPGLLHIRKLLRGGTLGAPLALQAQVGQYLPDWRPGRDYRRTVTARRDLGGGVILELSHELDYARWLMGPVHAVSCLAARVGRLETDVETLAMIQLELAGGALGSIQLDCLQRAPSRTCRIVCEQGTILWDHNARSVRWFEADSNAGRWQRFDYPGHLRETRFLEELRRTLDALSGKSEPAANLADGRRTLELALAAAASARTRAMIPLPETSACGGGA
ncbi:MAG: Gfo/Idh/MocA family protein [Thermoanaerobaculia bacterium]